MTLLFLRFEALDMAEQRTEQNATGLQMPLVVVVGGSGYLGLHLLKSFAFPKSGRPRYTVAFTYNSRPLPSDAENRLGVHGFHVDLATGDGFASINAALGPPTVVVNCAAVSVPRSCEENPSLAMAINVPRSLLKWMSSFQYQRPPLLIHLSTDQVYEGIKSFYTEDDETKPVNAYGKSKVAAEQFIQTNWSNYVILRSSIIYGPQPFVAVPKTLPLQWIDSMLSTGNKVDFFYNEYRCPILVYDVVELVETFVTKFREDAGCIQLLANLGGPDRMSRAEMAEVVAELRGYDRSLISYVSSEKVNRGVASPADISMDISRLQSLLNWSPSTFIEGAMLTFSIGKDEVLTQVEPQYL